MPCTYPGDALTALWSDRPPSQSVWLRELVDVVFFASLETEEGAPSAVRVAFHESGAAGVRGVREHEGFGGARWSTSAWQVLPFEPGHGVTDFTIASLVKAAPMAALPRTALIVGASAGTLQIDGLGRRLRRSFADAHAEEDLFVCTSTKPGQIILSVRGYPFFWYESGGTVDVLAGVELDRLLSEKQSLINRALRDMCAGIISAGKVQPFERDCYYLVSRVVRTLVETMAQTSKGGLLALLPSTKLGMDDWDGKYQLVPAARAILRDKIEEVAKCDALQWANTLEREPLSEDQELNLGISGVEGDRARDELLELAENIGRLASVDNAVLFGSELTLLCAGYQVVGENAPPQVFETTAPDGASTVREFPLQQYGSRHRAAANFAERHPGSVVFVSSEDGALRCLHRPCDDSRTLLWSVRAAVEL